MQTMTEAIHSAQETAREVFADSCQSAKDAVEYMAELLLASREIQPDCGRRCDAGVTFDHQHGPAGWVAWSTNMDVYRALAPLGAHSHGVPAAVLARRMLEEHAEARAIMRDLVDRGPLLSCRIASADWREVLIAWGLATLVVVYDKKPVCGATPYGAAVYAALAEIQGGADANG